MVKQEVQLPAELLALYDEVSGMGISYAMDDRQIPYIAILQKNSPQVDENTPNYIEGAKPGDILLTNMNRVWRGSTGIVFQPAGTERMRITSGGILMINRTATGGQNARVQVSSSGTDGYFIEQISSGGFCNASIAISNGGTYYFNYFQAGGTGVGSITSNGTTTAYNVTSDYRLKEDLKPINGLNIVNKINVYDYKWKSENSRMDGVLAHELQEILPYAVTGEKDGKNMQGVDYSKIVPVLVKAIQELSAKVSLLENK